MKTLRSILACVCGFAVLATAAYSGIIARKMRLIMAELVDVALPLSTRTFLLMPAWLYVGLGLIAGGILLWGMRRMRPPWLSIPVSVFAFLLIFAYLGIFSVAMLRPIGSLITGLDTTGTNQVEQVEFTVPSEGAPSEVR